MNKFHDLTIIIPAYNEENAIICCLKEFYKEFQDAYFIVVDNNSSDNTFTLANQFFKKNNVNGVVLQEKMQGKGYAVSRALREVRSKHYIMTDADITYSASDALLLYKLALNDGYDMVCGNRLEDGSYEGSGSRSGHQFGNMLLSKIVSKIFKRDVGDLLTGLRVLTFNIAQVYPSLAKGFDLETDLAIFCMNYGFSFYEHPITYRKRAEGSQSKLNTFSDGLKIVKRILLLFVYYKPLKFYSIVSLFFLITCIFLGYPIISFYLETGLVPRLPTAILSASFGVLSFLMLSTGLILDSISYQTKVLINAPNSKR